MYEYPCIKEEDKQIYAKDACWYPDYKLGKISGSLQLDRDWDCFCRRLNPPNCAKQGVFGARSLTRPEITSAPLEYVFILPASFSGPPGGDRRNFPRDVWTTLSTAPTSRSKVNYAETCRNWPRVMKLAVWFSLPCVPCFHGYCFHSRLLPRTT